MKTVSTLFLTVFLISGELTAQSTYVQTTGTYAPYSFRASGTDVLTATADNVLSDWQTLPFAWTFFGSPVTGYYVSDNGYITFDSLAEASIAVNDLPPSVGSPNNAIYGFWDDLRLLNLGAADRVTTFTYGKAPARVHVIQWFSVTPALQSTFLYVAIRLYECGDFDIVLNYSNAGGLTATVGAENSDGTQAVVVAGSPNYAYPGGSTSGSADDVVFRFYNGAQPTYDLRMLTTGLPYDAASGGNVNVTGTLENNGSATITSFDLSYTVNGGGAVTEALSGFNITPGNSYSYSHPTAYPVASTGHLDFEVWTSNLNGANPDESTCDDSVSATVAATLGITGTKHVLIEEFSGAWCQFCPDGLVILEQLTATFPDVVYASIHGGGGNPPYEMEIPEGVEISNALNDAFPKACMDRVYFPGETAVAFTRSLWASRTAARFNDPTPVDVSLDVAYDDVNRLVDVTVDADFVDYAAGDLRVSVYVVEDSVTGTGIAYNQVNFYNTQVGHPFYQAGNPIIGYAHPRVLRLVPTTTWGDASVISPKPNPSDNFSKQYTGIALDTTWDDSQIYVLAFVSHHSDNVQRRTVLNSIEQRLIPVVVSVDDRDAGLPARFALYENYPNPFNPSTTIRYDLPRQSQVSLKVFNILGEEVATLVNEAQPGGKYELNWNGKNRFGQQASSGVYVYRLQAGDFVQAKKMMLLK